MDPLSSNCGWKNLPSTQKDSPCSPQNTPFSIFCKAHWGHTALFSKKSSKCGWVAGEHTCRGWMASGREKALGMDASPGRKLTDTVIWDTSWSGLFPDEWTQPRTTDNSALINRFRLWFSHRIKKSPEAWFFFFFHSGMGFYKTAL